MQLSLIPQHLDDIRHDNGASFWRARELYHLLGYKDWENFQNTIKRAIQSCKNSGVSVEENFRDSTKMVEISSGAKEAIKDYNLTRYACYLIAINGDPIIPEIALSQAYFAIITRKQEVLRQRIDEIERIVSRRKLKETELEFAKTVYECGVDGPGIGEIRDFGDRMLFGGYTTQEMKRRLNISLIKPLADVLPNVLLKAKEFAISMTTFNTKKKNLDGKQLIKSEHKNNNLNVRVALTKTGIYPERLPASEDIKQIERKHERERKLLMAQMETKKKELEQKQQKEIQNSLNGNKE